MPNIYDISKKAGVSIATVSRVLNNSPNVSERTREKVLAVMDATGYTPNAFARGLGLKTMQTVGIMCADLSDPFFANAVYFLEKDMRQRGYNSLLCCTGYAYADKKDCLSLILSKHVDAVVFVGSTYLEAKTGQMAYILHAADEVPVVMINAALEHPNICCVLNDDYGAMYAIVSRLLGTGLERVMYLHDDAGAKYSGREKMRGYRTALRDHGLAAREALVVTAGGDVDAVCAALAAGNWCDAQAVVAAVDLLAVGFLKYARKAGIRVPEDCSVVGYDNSLLARCCVPELTSMDNHIETLCQTAIANLMQLFAGTAPPRKTIVAGDMVARQTTAAGIF